MAAQVLPILCLAQVFYVTQTSFPVGITLKRKTEYIPLILSGVALTTLVANFLLVPHFGIIGAGFAGLLSAIVFAVLTYTISQRLYHVEYDAVRAAKVPVVLLSVFAIARVLGTFLPSWLFWGVRILALPFSLLMLCAWRFFQEDELQIGRRQLTLLTEQVKALVRGG